MSRNEIKSYDYVNHSYARVREALLAEPSAIFREATRSAAARARSVAAELRVTIAGIDVGAEIAVTVGNITEDPKGLFGLPVTRLPLSWQAADHPELFPVMSAEMKIYPLTSTETQVDFEGHYQPPLGVVGGVMDALVGHRLAEASVHRFIADIAQHLRTRLTES